jgi:hypothetical protein
MCVVAMYLIRTTRRFFTVIITSSLPGRPARSFDKRVVTFASFGGSFGPTVIDSRLVIIKISFGIVISFRLITTSE